MVKTFGKKILITILGIHDGHNCGATILQDGHIKYSISEERLTRKKMKLVILSVQLKRF